MKQCLTFSDNSVHLFQKAVLLLMSILWIPLSAAPKDDLSSQEIAVKFFNKQAKLKPISTTDKEYSYDLVPKQDEKKGLWQYASHDLAITVTRTREKTKGKIKEYCDIMQELLLQGVVAEFDQINLTDSNHLYLRYQDGFVAELGTLNELMAKIGTLRAVVAELRANGLGSGYIDVSIPGEAVYTPE